MHSYELEFRFHVHADDEEAARAQLALFLASTAPSVIADRAECREIDTAPAPADA